MQKREATEKYLEKLITFKTSYEISTVPQLTSTSISDAMVDCGLNSSKKTRRRAQCSSSDPPIGTYTNAINIYVACVQKCAEINLFTVRCHAIARAHSILSSSSSRCMVAPFHTKLNYIKNYVWNLAIACWVFLSLSPVLLWFCRCKRMHSIEIWKFAVFVRLARARASPNRFLYIRN